MSFSEQVCPTFSKLPNTISQYIYNNIYIYGYTIFIMLTKIVFTYTSCYLKTFRRIKLRYLKEFLLVPSNTMAYLIIWQLPKPHRSLLSYSIRNQRILILLLLLFNSLSVQLPSKAVELLGLGTTSLTLNNFCIPSLPTTTIYILPA